VTNGALISITEGVQRKISYEYMYISCQNISLLLVILKTGQQYRSFEDSQEPQLEQLRCMAAIHDLPVNPSTINSVQL
jgi:hypothetical protein